jgi:hypothetical protein
MGAMFFFRHPKPVVDRRPVAEHSVQVEARDLPPLVELTERAASPPPGPSPLAGMSSGTASGASRDNPLQPRREDVRVKPGTN